MAKLVEKIVEKDEFFTNQLNIMQEESSMPRAIYMRAKLSKGEIISLEHSFMDEEDSVLILYSCDDLLYTIQEYLKLDKNHVFFHPPSVGNPSKFQEIFF